MYNYIKGFIHAFFALFAFTGFVLIMQMLEKEDEKKNTPEETVTPLFPDPTMKY